MRTKQEVEDELKQWDQPVLINKYIVRRLQAELRAIKKSEVKPKQKPDFDLNNDGKVDKKDVSLAAKFLGKQRKKK